MNNNYAKKRKLIFLCLFFAVFFAALGVVQLILGRKNAYNIQIIMAVVTWVYSVILFAAGFISLAVMRKKSGNAVKEPEPVVPLLPEERRPVPDAQPQNERERLSLDDIAVRLRDYTEYASRLENGTGVAAAAGDAVFALGVMMENAFRLRNEYSDKAEAAHREQEKAFNDASDAFMEVDSGKMKLKQLSRDPDAVGRELEAAQSEMKQAEKHAKRTDERLSALQRREAKARKLSQLAQRYASECEALRSRIERYS